MNVADYYRSVGAELEALKNRVRHLIDDGHWPTDGEWKESVLRTMLARSLPQSVKVGRGFILTKRGPSTQCDVILYRADCPVFFQDGDLVFVSTDAVLAVIEVKSKVNRTVLRQALQKLADIGRLIGDQGAGCCLALFAYATDMRNGENILSETRNTCIRQTEVVQLMSLGSSTFVRWWPQSPTREDRYFRWHAYELDDLAAGYFIANLVEAVSPESVHVNSRLWFPSPTKELRVTAMVDGPRI